MTTPARERMVRTIWRRQRIAGWASGVIGSAVVFMGIGFLIPIFLNPNQRSEVALENLPIVIVSVTGGGLLLMWISLRGSDDAFGWALEGREPTEQEQRLALRLATARGLPLGDDLVSGRGGAGAVQSRSLPGLRRRRGRRDLDGRRDRRRHSSTSCSSASSAR